MIDKKFLSQYLNLERCIEDTENKIERYRNMKIEIERDRVYGSSSEFPYVKRGFNIEGYNGRKDDIRKKSIENLCKKLDKQLAELELMKIKIELFVQEIPDVSTRLMFSYIYINGMTQDDVAKKLGVEQCTVSKRITRYLTAVKSESGL